MDTRIKPLGPSHPDFQEAIAKGFWVAKDRYGRGWEVGKGTEMLFSNISKTQALTKGEARALASRLAMV